MGSLEETGWLSSSMKSSSSDLARLNTELRLLSCKETVQLISCPFIFHALYIFTSFTLIFFDELFDAKMKVLE